jgi:transcriptional regulator with XRE-family HTH domain
MKAGKANLTILKLMNLKNQLKLLMERNFLTITTLSQKASVPKSTISDWLGGSVPRDLRKLKKVADALNTTVDHLCFGKGLVDEKEKFTQYQEEIFAGIYEVVLRKPKVNKNEK